MDTSHWAALSGWAIQVSRMAHTSSRRLWASSGCYMSTPAAALASVIPLRFPATAQLTMVWNSAAPYQ